MTLDQNIEIESLSEDQVIEYLDQHRHFFADKPALLAEMRLPHETGEAISLVEKQVDVLRGRNKEMHQRLNSLIENARLNDQLFEKTKRLILSLLEAQDAQDAVNALLESFSQDFEIQQTRLLLFSDVVDSMSFSQGFFQDNVIITSIESAKAVLGTIITNNQAVCGQLGDQEKNLIFTDKTHLVESSALMPLQAASPIGVLAIGNSDSDYYRSSMSTLFLSYIGDVLNRILPLHLKSQ